MIRATQRVLLLAGTLVLLACCVASSEPELAAGEKPTWRVGVARVKITPQRPIWMSGYASRNHPAEGKLTDLWAKALVLEDAQGKRAVLVTLDLVGMDRRLGRGVRQQIAEALNVPLGAVALNCSHTHTGPVVGENLRPTYGLDEEQTRLIAQYTAWLRQRIVQAAQEAAASLAPAQVYWGQGRATFAVNRRNNREADVPRLRREGKLRGPVDHRVPVLVVRSPQGKLRAVVAGYACHATVLSFYLWSGDYPGFFQIALEKDHPGTVAMFVAGCGGDQNPLPRRKVEYAKEYGRRLADAVNRVLEANLRELKPQLAFQYREIPLALAHVPSRQELQRDLQSKNVYIVRRAKLLLEQLDREGRIPGEYPYPVQSWLLGGELLWVFLGGEVVVDFSLRLHRELGPPLWVAGYSNDVMAYIPSLRVLREGGYEGARAMIYYGLPSPWASDVEARIVEEVHRQAQALGRKVQSGPGAKANP